MEVAVPNEAALGGQWWLIFDDRTLDRLESRALENNQICELPLIGSRRHRPRCVWRLLICYRTWGRTENSTINEPLPRRPNNRDVWSVVFRLLAGREWQLR